MSEDFWLGVLAAAIGPLAIAALWWIAARLMRLGSRGVTYLMLHGMRRDYRTVAAAYAYASERAWAFGAGDLSVIVLAHGRGPEARERRIAAGKALAVAIAETDWPNDETDDKSANGADGGKG